MSNSTKIIIAILDFIVCAAIGYMGMTLLSRARDRSSERATSSAQAYSSRTRSATSGGSSRSARLPDTGNGGSFAPSTPAVTPPSQDITDTRQPASDGPQTIDSALGSTINSTLEILEITTPQYDEYSKTYSFQVVASGIDLTYTLADAKKKDLQNNDTGVFNVQPSTSGKYYVYITDIYGNKTDYTEVKGCYRPVNKLFKDEFQEVLNSGKSQSAIDADFANRVSSGCRYEFIGINEDEVPPGSYNEIINRIRMRTWSSVTVLSVTHSSETNKLVRARIQVNY